MGKAIKNYTTAVEVFTSLGEVQGALAGHGARKIMVDYDEAGQPVAVAFQMETTYGMGAFLLPANVAGVRAAFQRQKVNAKPEQAARTAWLNIRDWVLAQMAFVEAGQVQADQVLLPYLTDGEGRTLYQAYTEGRLELGAGR